MSLAGRITIPNSWLKACTNIQSTRNINIPFYSFVRAPSNQKVVTKFFSPDKITSHMPCHMLQAALPYSEAHQALLPTIAVSPCRGFTSYHHPQETVPPVFRQGCLSPETDPSPPCGIISPNFNIQVRMIQHNV